METNGLTQESAGRETIVPQLGGALIRALVLLLDLDNIAWRRTTPDGKPMLANILAVIARVEAAGVSYLGIAGPALWHKVDDSQGFERLLNGNQRRIVQSPPGAPADIFLLAYAKELNGQGKVPYIMTNDTFKDHVGGKDFPFVRFMIMPDGTILTSPKLEKLQGAEHDQHDGTICEVPLHGSDQEGGAEASPTLKPIDPTLLQAVARLLVGVSTAVNFSGIAGKLHAAFGGSFTRTYGYRRPGDLAKQLRQFGLVEISFRNTTMYVSPTAKLKRLSGLGENSGDAV